MNYEFIDGFPAYNPKGLKNQIAYCANVEWDSFDRINDYAFDQKNKIGIAKVIGYLSNELSKKLSKRLSNELSNELSTVLLPENILEYNHVEYDMFRLSDDVFILPDELTNLYLYKKKIYITE